MRQQSLPRHGTSANQSFARLRMSGRMVLGNPVRFSRTTSRQALSIRFVAPLHGFLLRTRPLSGPDQEGHDEDSPQATPPPTLAISSGQCQGSHLPDTSDLHERVKRFRDMVSMGAQASDGQLVAPPQCGAAQPSTRCRATQCGRR